VNTLYAAELSLVSLSLCYGIRGHRVLRLRLVALQSSNIFRPSESLKYVRNIFRRCMIYPATVTARVVIARFGYRVENVCFRSAAEAAAIFNRTAKCIQHIHVFP
jgi:hypothetical protein